jgi:hypothetical protein
MSVAGVLRPTDVERNYDEDGGDGAVFDDMYYLGESIPSRSFHLLQSAVGNDPHGKYCSLISHVWLPEAR